MFYLDFTRNKILAARNARKMADFWELLNTYNTSVLSVGGGIIEHTVETRILEFIPVVMLYRQRRYTDISEVDDLWICETLLSLCFFSTFAVWYGFALF